MPGLSTQTGGSASMVRGVVALVLFAVGFLCFLLAPLVALGVAAAVYGIYMRVRRRGTPRAQAPHQQAAAVAPKPRASFGGGVR